MRNYIILNDINSNTINGLLIQELPPISKPKMRTRTEEIDGRAGDIVTQLGFKAYDKTIKIGLYGDFDINEVISYFNSSGQVVFSNEPDKYYNYQILEQIDYERLIRFRTAKVKMHVQPFKYPTEEEPLVGQYQYVSDTGSNLSLNNTADALFKKFDLKGNTSQNGTPTPDAPIPVNVVSGDNYIDICGKNLFDCSSNIIDNANIDNINNIIKSDNTCKISYVKCQPNTTYTISRRSPMTNRFVVATMNSLPSINTPILSVLSKNDNTTTSITITTPSNANYIVIRFIYNEINDYETYAKTIQVEKGSTQTIIEPYIGSSYPISLGSIELCKIGNYVDFIFPAINGNSYYDSLTQAQKNELIYGSWYLHKEIGKVVLDGSESWSKSSTTNIDRFYIGLQSGYFDSYNRLLAYSNYFKYTTNLSVFEVGNMQMGSYQQNTRLFLDYSVYNTTTLEQFKTWLSTHNTIVYYVLATPTTTEITDDNLIEQLEALKQANSYDGQTNISQEYNGSPFILDVAAVQKGSDELVVDNEGNIYSRPTIDLEGTGIVNVYLEGNQMFQIDLTDTNEIVIDTDEMEAYNPTTQALMNRQVTGNYDNFKLNVGDNTLKFSGDLTKATVTNYVRWL